MIVLGLIGKRGCGKDTVAEYLSKRYGFNSLDYTKDVLAPILKKMDKKVTRENLVNLAMDLREKYGNDILTRKICEHIKSRGLWVVSGVRFLEEVYYFRKKFLNKFLLIAVKCNTKIRFQRIKERGLKGEAKLSYKEFLKGEKLPTEKIIPRTIMLADFIIENNGSKEDLSKEIDKLMKSII